MEIIKPQPTELNPYIVDNYPYGWKRTKIRYYVESVKKKGDRFVSQTLNPKTNKWNKPKKDTYNAVVILYKNDIGHIKGYHYYRSTDEESYNKFMNFKGDLELNKLQEESLKISRAFLKTYKNVNYSIRKREFKHKLTGEIVTQIPLMEMGNYEEVTQEEQDKKQEENELKIRKSVVYNYSHDNGVLN